MSKVYGLFSTYAPLREERSRTVACYDLQAEPDGKHATWHEVYFYHKRDGKPTLASIRRAIEDDINARTDERILSGFVWESKNVWLSRENEFNFKAAYDIAVQTEGTNIPIKFKLGESADGTPVYHTFRSLSSLQDFYMQAIAYIQQCLADGWQMKDSIDWSKYVQ